MKLTVRGHLVLAQIIDEVIFIRVLALVGGVATAGIVEGKGQYLIAGGG